jgi:hypothetical protein
VSVTIDSVTLTVGHAAHATATAKDAAGNVISGLPVAWLSLSPGVATVSSTGLVAAISADTAVIQATISGMIGTAIVTVINQADLTSNNFDAGTWGLYTIAIPTDEDIVLDPTGSGRGMVARFHYAGINQDRNRSLLYSHPLLFTQSLFARGEFYVATSSLGDGYHGRKLLYWQPHGSYAKYGTNPPAFWSVVGMQGSDLWIDDGYVSQAGVEHQAAVRIASGMLPSRWYRIEHQITMESRIGAGDGTSRVWLDGTLIYENLSVAWTDPAWVGQPLAGGNGTPLDLADVYFENFSVGDQVNYLQGAFDEYRYWDNVAFSTNRIDK